MNRGYRAGFVCPKCGDVFERRLANVIQCVEQGWGGPYCGKSCGRDRRVSRMCEHCKGTFLVRPSALQWHKHDGRFCSRQCASKAKTLWPGPLRAERNRELAKAWHSKQAYGEHWEAHRALMRLQKLLKEQRP